MVGGIAARHFCFGSQRSPPKDQRKHVTLVRPLTYYGPAANQKVGLAQWWASHRRMGCAIEVSGQSDVIGQRELEIELYAGRREG